MTPITKMSPITTCIHHVHVLNVVTRHNLTKKRHDSYPNIKFPRPDSLRDTDSVNDCTRDVENSHEDEPTQGGEIDCLPESVRYHVVHRRDDPAQTKAYKHSCNHGNNKRHW